MPFWLSPHGDLALLETSLDTWGGAWPRVDEDRKEENQEKHTLQQEQDAKEVGGRVSLRTRSRRQTASSGQSHPPALSRSPVFLDTASHGKHLNADIRAE